MLIRKPSALAYSEGIQSQFKEVGSEAEWEGRGQFTGTAVSGSRWTRERMGVGGAGSAPLSCGEFKNRAKRELGVAWNGQMPSPYSIQVCEGKSGITPSLRFPGPLPNKAGARGRAFQGP